MVKDLPTNTYTCSKYKLSPLCYLSSACFQEKYYKACIARAAVNESVSVIM